LPKQEIVTRLLLRYPKFPQKFIPGEAVMNGCPNCGFENPTGIHICLNCASSLKMKCHHCQAEVPLGNRFCGNCGTPIKALDPAQTRPFTPPTTQDMQQRMLQDIRSKMPESMVNKFVQVSRELYGQRREVTVLAVEIANFLAISKELDSETIYLAVDEIIHILVEVVYKYEGTIDKYSGNGIMALFGLPLNHENDPERVVRAALEMQHRMNQLRDYLIDRYQYEFQIVIGINTGIVIAGYMTGHQHLEYTVIGDTIHLATQLQRSAQPGSTLVSFRTYQRSRPVIDFRRLPSIQVEGISEPITAFQPIGIRMIPGQVRGLPGLQVPMIGRSDLLEQLIRVYTNVIQTGSSDIIFCSGEAGIGKSRLVAEFKHYLANHQVTMAQGTCALYMRITPYRVVADVLRSILGISELDPVNEQRKILQRYLEQYGLDRNDILPYMMHVLGILQSDPVLEVRIKLLDPSMLLRQTHFALRMFFIAESRQAPLVLVFDDLHWVDQPSAQFLEYLSQSFEASPILMMMVARDFERYSFVKAIRSAADKHIRKPHDICIQPLKESDAHLLVDQLVHENTKPARVLKQRITARAGGNPYFTEELVRILMDHSGLVNKDGTWKITDLAEDFVHEIPGTLGDIILGRFDHLNEQLKNVLLKASVLGASFTVRLLEALVTNESENLTDALQELEDRAFLLHTKFDIEEGYIFKHPLAQETIYKTLLKRDSKKLHTLVAQAIETGDYWLPGERNEVLAYHLAESAKPSRAIPYLLISAEKAYQNFANDTAVQHYRHALALMETEQQFEFEQKMKAKVGLAKVLKFTGELEEAAQNLVDIVEGVGKANDTLPSSDGSFFELQIDALRELADIRAREGDLEYAVNLLKQGLDLLSETGRKVYPVIWRRLLDRLAWVYFRQRNLDEAYNLVDLALLDTAAWETEDPITLASLYNTMGGIYWTRSRFTDAIESVEHSLEVYKNLNYHWGMAISLANLGILHYSTGKWQQAVEHLEHADRLRQEYGDDPERPTNLKNLGEVLIDLGDFSRARSNLLTSRDISQRLGLNFSQAHAEFGLCRLAQMEGSLEEARQHLLIAQKLLGSLDEINDRVATYYLLQAQLEIEEGNYLAAQKSCKQAFSVAQQGDLAEMEPDILKICGMVSARTGEYEQSEKFLNRSIELAQALKDRFCEAKTQYELGLLFFKLSERSANPNKRQYLEQAGRSIDVAIRIFETLGAAEELQRAKNARVVLPLQGRDGNENEGKHQTGYLRSQLHLPEGEWYQSAVISTLIKPTPGVDEEYIFETIAFLIPSLSNLIRESGCQLLHHRDGLTAIFGAPISHEDDIERAVETGLLIANFYHELDQQTDLPVTIQVGISMGKIVAGMVGGEEVGEFRAAGEPIQWARTIAESSPSGRVWVDQDVRNRTSFRFEYSQMAAEKADSFPENNVFQLEGVREQFLPVRGLLGLTTPYIGRDHELKQMEQMSQVLSGKTGGIIWIEGEAGIGKSRLMRVFSKQVEKYHARVVAGVCTARHSEHAFSLFSDLLMQVFEIQHHFNIEQINKQLDEKIVLWSPELTETRPFLQLLLGVQPNDAQGDRINSMEPEQLRRQIFVAIHRLFSVMAEKQPLVFMLDDLQWIDSISGRFAALLIPPGCHETHSVCLR
jgi:predicted ATPase/class 3 adenylate cyclase